MNPHLIRVALAACGLGAVAAAVGGHIVLAFTLTIPALFCIAESQRDAPMSTATTDAAATGGRVAAPSGSPGAACPKYATAHPLAAVLSAQAAMADLTGDMWLDAARIAAMQQLVHHQP